MRIDDITIGINSQPLVIPEIGACHDGSVTKALTMLDEIKVAGAQCAKFQMYSSEELVADTSRLVTWGNPCQEKVREKVGDMFSRLALSRNDMATVFDYARSIDLVPIASPFSIKGIDDLMKMNADCIKIAASDVNYHQLLRHAAQTKKPILLSLGKCSLSEADESISILQDEGCTELAILHCVATYPSPMKDVNLRVILALKELYPECIIGFSDHSLGLSAPLAAVALGARIIEKHVTINKDDYGPDHWFSLDMDELRDLITGVNDVFEALGHPRKKVLRCERDGRNKATRSLVAAEDILAGTIITERHIKVVRPGSGLAPKYLNIIIGMELRRDIKTDDVFTWDIFKE